MNWIDRIFKREAAEAEPKQQAAVGADYKQNVVWANTPTRAMKIAAVFRAVNLISSGLASLKLEYKRKDRVKGYFKFDNGKAGSRLNYLLSVQPNSRMNASVFLKNLVSQILLQGNAYVLPVKNILGEVEALYLLTPGSVAHDVYTNAYQVADPVNVISGVFSSEEILHFKNVSNDGGYTGISTISYAALTLGIAATSDNETLKRFATGGRFKAILKNNTSTKGWGEYQDEQLKAHGDDLQDAINRGDDILAVKGDVEVSPLSMSSADMQFLESRKFTIREIARFFNVPPSKLMDDSNSNYKSVEVSNIAFYTEALQPIVTEIEREFSAKLLNEWNYQDYKFCFDLSALYALDLESKARWDKNRLENGLVSVNDLRRERDIEPIEKGDDVYLSVNFAPLGSAKLSGEVVKSE
jgi:HK97 family phage portal protein